MTRDARVADVVVEVDDADVVVVRVVASDDVVRDVVSATVDVVEATDDVVPVAVSRTDTRLFAWRGEQDYASTPSVHSQSNKGDSHH